MHEHVESATPRPHETMPDFHAIVAISMDIRRAKVLAQRAVDLDLPVLLEGEAGTGKRLFARAIHTAGGPARGSFQSKCYSGVRREAVAGSAGQPIGQLWDAAAGGTLFLNDVCDMPSEEQQELQRLLSNQPSAAQVTGPKVRLICSSGRNLVELVRSGQFSEKLFYQMSVFPIWLPPLRMRSEDIPALISAFLGKIIPEFGKPIGGMDKATEDMLRAYSWPGNVRQLETAVYRAVAIADGYQLTPKDFPHIIAQMSAIAPNTPGDEAYGAAQMPHSSTKYEGPAMIGGSLHGDRAVTLTPLGHSGRVGIPATNEEGEFRRLEEIEADVIRLALGHYRGHITEIARRLGIGRSTLYRKMREFGLSPRHN